MNYVLEDECSKNDVSSVLFILKKTLLDTQIAFDSAYFNICLLQETDKQYG